jgi:hypothetical protein
VKIGTGTGQVENGTMNPERVFLEERRVRFLLRQCNEQREDGRHSPAEVLGWVTGKQFEPDYDYRAFSAIGETRTLTKAGYARFPITSSTASTA